MCGICGAIGADIQMDRLVAATNLMRHRGPDEAGYLCEGPVALGMRRLSIIDLAGGQQPKTDERGRFKLIFNGEIYNYRELRDELRSRGHEFASDSDTEVIVHAYEEWSFGAFGRLNGIFAIAIWDSEERRLVLARDHLGVKPLYYASFGASLAFGSELKPLLALLPEIPPIDPVSADLLLRYQYVPSPRSILQGVQKLTPGHYLVAALDGSSPRVCRFWDPLEAASNRGNIRVDEAVELVHDALGRAVKRQLVSDVPLGAFLSGGVDSSAIVALMQASSDSTTKTFSIGFEDAGADESVHARAVAEHLGTEHYSWTITDDDAMGVIPQIPHYYDEPFGDSSSVPTFLVSRLAKQHVTVALSGDGGDELFSGYTRYLEMARLGAWWMLPLGARRAAIRAAGAMPGPLGRRFGNYRGVLLTPDLGNAYRNRVSVARDQLLGELTCSGELASVANEEWPLHLFGERPLHESMMLTDLVTYLPDCILTKVDRASMAHSLETRVPLLDPELVELVLRIPSRIHLSHGQKTVLKRVLERYVPRQLFDRPKHGFRIPIDEWLRGGLRECLTDYVSPRALNDHGLFRTGAVTALLDAHLEGRVARGQVLWTLLMFQMWYAEFYRRLPAITPSRPKALSAG